MSIQGNLQSARAPTFRAVSTALLVLVTLKNRAPDPMSTYELGLWIIDNKIPPRPLSKIMKTLADDGYIVRTASAGKRAGLWAITERGLLSLQQRPKACQQAEEWLRANPNYSAQETAVLMSLLNNGSQSIGSLVETCSLLLSPVRTALKRLSLRKLAHKTVDVVTTYMLTPDGQNTAETLACEQNRKAV